MNLNATLIIEVLSFLILLGLLSKLLYRPVLKMLDQRAQEIKETNQKIQENLTLAQKQHQQAQKILANSKIEAIRLKEQVRQDAEDVRREIIEQAKAQADRVVQASRQDIANEAKMAQKQLKDKTIDLSVQIAEKIIQRSIQDEDRKRMIRELTKEIKDGRGNSSR